MAPHARTEPAPQPRIPLSRHRVLLAAVALADQGGIEALTMRKLADALGVEAMSLYHHVANKEAILDGIVEVVAEEINDAVSAIDPPSHPDDWKSATRQRIVRAREVLLRHRWAPAVMETRTTMNPAVVTYYDGMLALFRAGGFSWDHAHHAIHALGSRALGFVRELFEPGDPEAGDAKSARMLEEMADRFPNIVAMVGEVSHGDPDSTLGWCDDQVEFEFGLDLILDGLDRLRADA